MSTPPFRTVTPSPRPQLVQERPRVTIWPFTVAILLGSIAVVYAVRGLGSVSVPPQIIAAPANPTISVSLRAVLELPTATATTMPTAIPTSAPTVPVTINYCRNPEPGMTCLTQPEPTVQATMQSCYGDPKPLTWCVWPESDPSTDGEGEIE